MNCFRAAAKKKFPFWLAKLSFDSKVSYNAFALRVHGKQSFGYLYFFIFKYFRYADYYYISQESASLMGRMQVRLRKGNL